MTFIFYPAHQRFVDAATRIGCGCVQMASVSTLVKCRIGMMGIHQSDLYRTVNSDNPRGALPHIKPHRRGCIGPIRSSPGGAVSCSSRSCPSGRHVGSNMPDGRDDERSLLLNAVLSIGPRGGSPIFILSSPSQAIHPLRLRRIPTSMAAFSIPEHQFLPFDGYWLRQHSRKSVEICTRLSGCHHLHPDGCDPWE